MKWIIALNEPTAEFLDHGKKYEYFAKIAVYSAKLNAPGLVPIMVYNGRENIFTKEMQSLGVEVIFHRLSFEDHIDKAKNRDGLWRQTAKGAMLRLDIPEIINTDETILYTDTDVFFLKDPSNYQFPCEVIAVAPEFEINNYSKINTGTMLINLGAAREKFKLLINWTLQNLEVVPDYDQGAVQFFFAGGWDQLHQLMNWKPYWGIHQDALVLHFHGPKPNDFDSTTLSPKNLGGIYETLYSANPSAYRYYLSKWISLSHQYQISRFDNI